MRKGNSCIRCLISKLISNKKVPSLRWNLLLIILYPQEKCIVFAIYPQQKCVFVNNYPQEKCNIFDNQQIMHLNLHNGQILRKIDLCNGQSSKAFTNWLQSVTGCELVTICYQLM